MATKKEDRYVTQAEFARKIGTTRQNVRYALNRGTIRFSTKYPTLLNYELQKKAYEQNRNLSQVRVRKPAKPRAKKKVAPKVEEEIKPIKNVPSMRSMGNIPLNDYDEEFTGDKDAVRPDIGSYADNQNRKVAIEADRHELKYAAELAQVIPTDVALSIAGAKMMSIKDALLAMPSRTTGLIEADVKTRVEEWKEGQEELLSNSITNILKEAINSVLLALSASVDTLPDDVEKSFEKKK